MSEALRYNTDKPQMAYVLQFPNAIKAVSRVMEFGGCKYADGNWKLGNKPDKEYLNSMMRHLTAWLEGEKYDEDSACSHLGHAIWNLLALHELNHPEETCDGRFKERMEFWATEKLRREGETSAK